MKFVQYATMLCCFACIACFANAQNATDEMVKEWERAKAYTKEYLEVMPADKYGLKPTPEMRSFAEQMLHLTDANYNFMASVTGEKPPFGLGQLEKTGNKTKDSVVKAVLAGYDFVISSIKKLTPAQLSETVKIFGRFEMTKEMALQKDFEHQTHHRGQTTVYLRMAGVKPPQEKLF